MLNTRQIFALSAISAALISTNVVAQNAVIVNGKSIPKAQLDKLVQKSGQPDNPQVRDQAREMLVTRELILQEANGILRVKADTVRRTATMAFCEAKLYNDQGEVCCMATGTFKYLKRLASKNAEGERVINDDARYE